MKKKLFLLALAVTAFSAGYGVVADAYPFPWPYSRDEYYGYWENRRDVAGKYVLSASCSGVYNYWNGQDNCNAIPNYVDTAAEFSSFIIDRYNNGNTTDRVGAAFIILTMIGENRTWPVTVGEQQEFTNRVAAVEPYTWWNFSGFTYNLNSYNQRGNDGVGPNDVALFDDNASGHRGIIFRTAAGEIAYMIKNRCANPVGFNTMPQLPDDLNFNMSGLSDRNPALVSPGQSISFTHSLTQSGGTTGTSPSTINWTTEAASSPSGPWTPVASGNAGTFTLGQTKPNIGNQSVIAPNSPPGTQICRRITWTPDTHSGGSESSTPACATIQYNFTLVPSINAVITSGGVPITGNEAEPGDSVTFTYAVNNTGTTESQSTTCTYRQATYSGFSTTAPVTTFTPAGANCPPNRTFPASTNTTTATETIASVAVNTSICRSLVVNPASPGGPASPPVQVCVHVVSKPYTRVWGGDVSAGNGLASVSGVCTHNQNAAIVGWNKRAAGSNAGAGVQFAAFAMARITDFASALYDPGGATSPTGLSFANTATVPASGDFGGGLGNAQGSAPCIPDYYATRPTTTLPVPANITAMVSGVYGANSNTYFSSNPNTIDAGERITVYVDGDVYINTNIQYNGTWTPDTVPLFEMIVRGNIYIDLGITRLDGVFVAQPRANGTGGEIHTCATTIPALYQPIPLSGNFHSQCDTKLTVNGLFVANQIRLLRTIGTLAQSDASELSTDTSIAETFNFGPALWMKQPIRQNQALTPDYDAIISLPPIL